MPTVGDTPATEETNQREVIAGSNPEYTAQMKLASMIEAALATIRAQARTNDYFVGYSLAEALEDRINVIGNDDSKDEEVNEFIPGTIATRTKISQLNYVYSLLLGADEGQTEGAIGTAKNAESPSELEQPEDPSDPGGVV